MRQLRGPIRRMGPFGQKGTIGIAAIRIGNHRLQHGVFFVPLIGFTDRLIGDHIRFGEARLQGIFRKFAATETDIQQPSRPFFQHSLPQGNGCKTEGCRLSQGGLFKQQAGSPHCHKVQIALMNFNREVGPVKVTLQGCRRFFQRTGNPHGVLCRYVGAWHQIEPAAPGRRQFRHQTGRQLIHRIGCRAIKQLIRLFLTRNRFR